MKPAIWLPSSCALILILTGCANNKNPGNDTGSYGPFDSAGNYRDDWADDPSKWRKPGKHEKIQSPADDLPAIAKNEQPPADANPLAPQSAQAPKITSKPTTRVETMPRESTSRQIAKHTEEPKREVTTRPKPKTTSSATKSKSTVAKAKSKPKPKSSRYVVKSGDSLSRIAARNGSSVSAIQKANGISGTLIHPGQSLVIPKR